MSVWSSEETFSINGEVFKEGGITVDDVKGYARNKGYKKFVVKGGERLLTVSDFPFEGNITVEPYNEAA